jgi:hypothetical protein
MLICAIWILYNSRKDNTERMKLKFKFYMYRHIQGVSEISALILTGNRTHQKEQLFSLPFWRKTLRNGLKL